RTAQQILFELRQRVGRNAGKLRVLVDAVIKNLLLIQSPGDDRSSRIEDEVYWSLKTKLAHRTLHLKPQQPAIEIPNPRLAINGHRDRVQHEYVLFRLA